MLTPDTLGPSLVSLGDADELTGVFVSSVGCHPEFRLDWLVAVNGCWCWWVDIEEPQEEQPIIW